MTELDILRDALRHAATFSHDPRTQVGAVLQVRGKLVYAANVIPPGVSRRGWRDKYAIVEHAERAVIYKAAAAGIPTVGGKMFAPWFACHDCARAMILAGVSEVVGLASLAVATPDRWRQQIDEACTMLEQAGVSTRWVSGPAGATIMFDGRAIQC